MPTEPPPAERDDHPRRPAGHRRAGEMIIAAAERAGVYIPRFCYHPRMKPVGMCRMCLVEVKGPRGFALMPACYNPVADGMEIVTDSPAAKKAQDGRARVPARQPSARLPGVRQGRRVPAAGPDARLRPGRDPLRRGEAPLGEAHHLSPLVLLDRERCIQCGRCIRFADEVAGDPLIDFAERGDLTEVATFPDEPFASYFSGNVVQICPVGALTVEAVPVPGPALGPRAGGEHAAPPARSAAGSPCSRAR